MCLRVAEGKKAEHGSGLMKAEVNVVTGRGEDLLQGEGGLSAPKKIMNSKRRRKKLSV